MLGSVLGPVSALALALVCQTPAPSAPSVDPVAGPITLEPTAPLAALLVNPSGATGRARSSTLIDLVERQVTAHTDLFVRWLDPVELSSCEGRLACITLQARPDYDRLDYELGNGTMAPFTEHLEHVAKKGLAIPTHLLVLSHVTGDDADRLSVRLVDTDRALATIHRADLRAPEAARRLEVALREAAVLSGPKWGEITDEASAARFIEAIFANDLRRPLDDAGHWEPQGTLQIEGVPSGLGIALDGRTIGTTQPGSTEVRGVSAGAHTLRLFAPDRDPYEARVTVERRKRTTLLPELAPAHDPLAQGLRRGLIWGGVGLAVAGAVVGTVALARAEQNVVTYCPQIGDDGGCSGSRFVSVGYDSAAAPTFDDTVDPGGVLLGPLGYSVAAVGATWTLSTLLFGDEDDIPWWQLAAGLVAGGAAYGISAALQPESPFAP